jgi:hypothetical protein
MAALSACASSGHTNAGVGGLTGGVLYNGGPPPGLSRNNGYRPGDIELIRDGSVIVRRHVREGDPYKFVVSPGEYTVRVRLGDLTCSSRATVRSGETTKADVLCSIK